MAENPIKTLFTWIASGFEFANDYPPLIDARALLLIVPSAMLTMRAIMTQSAESCAAWIIVAVLSFKWMHERLKHNPNYHA